MVATAKFIVNFYEEDGSLDVDASEPQTQVPSQLPPDLFNMSGSVES